MATAILTGKYVLTPIQPRVMRNISALGRYAPRRPNGARQGTIWLTPVLWPITVKAAKIAQPTMLPSTMTAMVSQSPRLRTMPSAPSAQLIGAMFAPAQIHICCGPVESLSASGMGSMLWTSTLSSARASVAMVAPYPLSVSGRSLLGIGAAILRRPGRRCQDDEPGRCMLVQAKPGRARDQGVPDAAILRSRARRIILPGELDAGRPGRS